MTTGWAPGSQTPVIVDGDEIVGLSVVADGGKAESADLVAAFPIGETELSASIVSASVDEVWVRAIG